MFKSITILTQNNRDPVNPIDIGWLVECMLFYEQTIVIANRGILTQLFRFFGVDRIIELIEEELLKIIYTESFVGVHTRTLNGIQYHDAVQFSSPQHMYQDEIRKICMDVTGKTGKGMRVARRVEDKIRVQNHDNIILEGARKSFLDQNYVSMSARNVIDSLVHEATNFDNMIFNTRKTQNGIEVMSNINFTALNEIYHKRVSPSHSTITSAFILSHLLTVETELYFSSNNLSELSSSPISSTLIEQKVNYILKKSKNSAEQINKFQQFVFSDSKALKEAVNSKMIDLDDLMAVLNKSKKFKKWISEIDPDKDLIKNYYKEVTKETIVDKLPGKGARWCIFTGLGLLADSLATGGLGTASGIALGALDTFYINKLISGWKPSQFIEEDVKKLIEK